MELSCVATGVEDFTRASGTICRMGGTHAIVFRSRLARRFQLKGEWQLRRVFPRYSRVFYRAFILLSLVSR
jgi:hypothetical protein